jgi:hypothetical protein
VIAAYVFTAGVGLPAHFWLARRGRQQAVHYLLAGTILGAAPLILWDSGYIVFVALASWKTPIAMIRVWAFLVRQAAPSVILCALCGGATALLFWRIAVRTNQTEAV